MRCYTVTTTHVGIETRGYAALISEVVPKRWAECPLEIRVSVRVVNSMYKSALRGTGGSGGGESERCRVTGLRSVLGKVDVEQGLRVSVKCTGGVRMICIRSVYRVSLGYKRSV